MTKAAVRGMDTVEALATSKSLPAPKKFLVSGYSKRGWTTWLTAAVAKHRVFAAAPIVQSGLNFEANLHHHYESLNGWSFALNDYVVAGLITYLDTPQMALLAKNIDPFEFRDRYSKQNILQLQMTSDEFFLPDDEVVFWDQLQTATGGSYLTFVPNTDHLFEGHRIRVFNQLTSFYLTFYEKQPAPSLKWVLGRNATHGNITATVDISNGVVPMKATVYAATTLSSTRRDFRLFALSGSAPVPNLVMWFTQAFSSSQPNPTTLVYTATFANPSSGWTGFYFEISFPGPNGSALPLTTEVNIIPNTYPAAYCNGTACGIQRV